MHSGPRRIFVPAADIPQAIAFFNLQDVEGAVKLAARDLKDENRRIPSLHGAGARVKNADFPAIAAYRFAERGLLRISSIDTRALDLGAVKERQHVELDYPEYGYGIAAVDCYIVVSGRLGLVVHDEM